MQAMPRSASQRRAIAFGLALQPAQRLRQHQRLVFVDDEHVEAIQQILRRRTGRREIEDDAAAGALHRTRRREAFGFRHLALQQQDVAFAERQTSQRIGPRHGVGAGRDDDLVGAGCIDGDEGRTRRRLDRCDMGQVDAIGDEQRQGDLGEDIAADGADEHDLGTGTAGGKRLVRTLAAGVKRVARADHRLARSGQAFDRSDQIDIERAEDDDHAETRSARRRTPATKAASGGVTLAWMPSESSAAP